MPTDDRWAQRTDVPTPQWLEESSVKLDQAMDLIEQVVSSLPGVPGMELEARLLDTRNSFNAMVRHLRQGDR